MVEIETDVLVVGAGGAGMYAAIAAAREGARVLLADKSMVGRGGATIMAQMTVAAAVAEQGPDDWTQPSRRHPRGGPRPRRRTPRRPPLRRARSMRIREMDEWRVGWARDGDGRMCQVTAPGHGVARCVYVDFLNTGPRRGADAASPERTHAPAITKASGLAVTDLVVNDGVAAGAVGFNLEDGAPVSRWRPARSWSRRAASPGSTGETAPRQT